MPTAYNWNDLRVDAERLHQNAVNMRDLAAVLDNWKDLRLEAERLQEDAVNMRDSAVVLEKTFDMVSSTRKKLNHLY